MRRDCSRGVADGRQTFWCEDWRAECESGDLDLGLPHPPPTNPQPMSVRPTTGGKRRGGRGAGIRHTHPPSPGSPASVSVQGKRPLDDSTVPSKRPDAPPILHPSPAPNMPGARPHRRAGAVESRLSQQAAAGSSIWYLLHLQLQLPGSRGFDTHFPAAATPVLSTNIVVNIKYHSTYLSVWSSRC